MHEAGSVVRAAPISGIVSFSGGVTVDNSNLTLATRFTSFAGVTVAQGATGDYSGLTPGLTVAMTPFSFAPFPGQVARLWQCSQGGVTYSFDLTTLRIDSRFTRALFLSGTGVARITGYDDTPGTWSFSMQGSTSFSFNATTTTPGWLGDWVWDDLVGSDKLEFRFYDQSGKVAIDFYLDTHHRRLQGDASRHGPGHQLSVRLRHPGALRRRWLHGCRQPQSSARLLDFHLRQPEPGGESS
jgi:hypothetical protein